MSSSELRYGDCPKIKFGAIQTVKNSGSMHEILHRLWLGDLMAAENIENLCKNEISFILSIRNKLLTVETREAYRKACISHVQILKADTLEEDLLSILEPVCDMIEATLAKGKAMLVHCKLGKSRSATIVIAYVMRNLNVSSNEASVFVQTKRPVVKPNTAFLEQLVEWQKCSFDLQNRVILDQETYSGTGSVSCTSGESATEKAISRPAEEDELAIGQPRRETRKRLQGSLDGERTQRIVWLIVAVADILMALERNIKDELPGILPMKPSTFHGGRDNPGDPPCGAEVSRPMKGDALKKGGNGESFIKPSHTPKRPRNDEVIRIPKISLRSDGGVKRPVPIGQTEAGEDEVDEMTGATEATRPKKKSRRASIVYPRIRMRPFNSGTGL